MMSLRHLSGYLAKIKLNTPINLPKFYRLVDKLILSTEYSSRHITGRKYCGDLYVDVVVPTPLLNELTALAAVGLRDTRIEAAHQNRSHSIKVAGSIINIRQGEGFPFVVMVDSQGIYSSPTYHSKVALLIENHQNFIDIDNTLRFLTTKTSFEYCPSMDIILSDGNKIANSLHKNFLSQYSHLYFYFDMDLGGLCTADNLSKLLPESTYTFLIPNDIQSRLEKVVEHQNAKYIHSVIKIGVKNKNLAPIAKLIKDNRKVIEQESYLYEYE